MDGTTTANQGGRMKSRNRFRASAASVGVTGAFALALAGCGGDDAKGEPEATSGTTAQAATATATGARARGPKVKLIDSDYGRILADGKGRALYLFTAESSTTSECYGDCATAWPPYLVKKAPAALPGVTQGKIGTTRRNDGSLQATYAGHPLYYYVTDKAPGQVTCQAVNEFGGFWYVVRANG